MADFITFRNKAIPTNYVNTYCPAFNYKVSLYFQFEFFQKNNGKLVVKDIGLSFDKRILSIEFDHDTTYQTPFNNFFNEEENRGQVLELDLTNLDSNTTFFPGGPDKGNSGVFECVKLESDFGRIREYPYHYWKPQYKFLLTSFPSYSLPSRTGFTEGNFRFGNITDLMEPDVFNSNEIDSMSVITSLGLDYSIVDIGKESKIYSTTFDLSANQPNAAAIINDIQTNLRNNSIIISNYANLYPFGISLAPSTITTCILNKKIINIVHKNDNRFYIDLSVTLDV